MGEKESKKESDKVQPRRLPTRLDLAGRNSSILAVGCNSPVWDTVSKILAAIEPKVLVPEAEIKP